MARRRLTAEEMLQLSAQWLDPQSPAHSAIAASADLAPSLSRIQTAHDILAGVAQPVPDNPRIAQISKEQAELDGRHDQIIRGTHALLTGTALLLGPDEGAPLLALRDLLIPDGPASIQKSYRAQTGQAAQLAARLSTDVRTQCTKLLVGPKNKSRTLSQFLDEWIAIGAEIGSLEDEKDRLAPIPSESNVNNAPIITARNKWIRAVNLFIATAEAAELDPQTFQLLFGPLLAAEAKAAKRGRLPAKTSNEAPSDPSDQ